ncbi:MAG TPA: Gfo/Idh/MocA family oxidoreductase [Acidobacteriota bacterium]|nr:Gfo/Idh/MocA family oxidoreductase [Acidobacteriota bacterium]
MSDPNPVKRRDFMVGAGKASAAAVSTAVLGPGLMKAAQSAPKIKLGLVGCGGRGVWIAKLFQKHGGYEIAAIADYFKDRADEAGTALDVPESRRFTGLSGYKRVLDAKVDAVAIESPPYFHPAQAAAAVDAGAHVYLAKPIAVDVPGCDSIAASARKATAKERAFLVDFQTRTHPSFIEALRRVHAGGLGDFVFGEATYHADSPWEQWYEAVRAEPANPEVRLRAWGLDRALSGDMITEQDIHTLDVMNWIMGTPPVYALGCGGLKARPKVGSCWDHFVVYYQYPSKVGVEFSGRQFKGHSTAEGIRNRMFGSKGVLETEYGGAVLIRGENYWNGGKTPEIYESGAVANIAAFHRAVVEGDFRNPTVAPSVQSNKITILGRKSAAENRIVTWAEILKDEERLEPDLKGLKD